MKTTTYTILRTMRLLPLTSFLMCLCTHVSYCQTAATKMQKNILDNSITPARGHYKQLQSFSVAPKSTNDKRDSLKYVADPAAMEKKLSLKPYYLPTVAASEFKIPSPPANSSRQTLAELQYLFELEKSRTEEDVKESHFLSEIYFDLNIHPGDPLFDENLNNLFYIGHSVGTWFNAKSLPLTADLLAKAWQDANYFIWALKYKYARIRPYILEPKLHNLEKAGSPSFPTGTATDAYLLAYIYQELAPEFKDVFVSDANKMAHSREIIGVHFPSDIEGSRILARQIVSMLFQNERFLKDFDKVRNEWASKGKENLTGMLD